MTFYEYNEKYNLWTEKSGIVINSDGIAMDYHESVVLAAIPSIAEGEAGTMITWGTAGGVALGSCPGTTFTDLVRNFRLPMEPGGNVRGKEFVVVRPESIESLEDTEKTMLEAEGDFVLFNFNIANVALVDGETPEDTVKAEADEKFKEYLAADGTPLPILYDVENSWVISPLVDTAWKQEVVTKTIRMIQRTPLYGLGMKQVTDVSEDETYTPLEKQLYEVIESTVSKNIEVETLEDGGSFVISCKVLGNGYRQRFIISDKGKEATLSQYVTVLVQAVDPKSMHDSLDLLLTSSLVPEKSNSNTTKVDTDLMTLKEFLPDAT